MIEISRRPYAYGTSHRLDEVEFEQPDGTRLIVLLKDLRASELGSTARGVKPDFLYDPRREVEAYGILANAGLGTAICHESGDDWLMLEKVQGVELWQIGDLDQWIEVAGWLARLHSHFALAPPRGGKLLVYDESYFRVWPDRAERKHPELGNILGGYQRVIELLRAQPSTLIHGEFYASNVLIDGGRIAPVDWEMAGIGPGILDLAALVSGWGEPERSAILAGYGEIAPEALEAARLHIAVQWLGWSPGWTPPPEHSRDWLGEALSAADQLGL